MQFQAGDSVPTKEPCLSCSCNGHSLVCNLRLCPQVRLASLEGCYSVKKKGQCCEEVVCGEDHSVIYQFYLLTR